MFGTHSCVLIFLKNAFAVPTGFMNTLAQLTDVGDVSPEMFIGKSPVLQLVLEGIVS